MNLPIRVREEGSRLFQCLQQHLVLFEHLTVCIIRRYSLVIERTNSRLVSLVAIAVSTRKRENQIKVGNVHRWVALCLKRICVYKESFLTLRYHIVFSTLATTSEKSTTYMELWLPSWILRISNTFRFLQSYTKENRE